MSLFIRQIGYLFCIVITIIAFRVFLFDIYKIPSISMSPTLEVGDYILVSKIASIETVAYDDSVIIRDFSKRKGQILVFRFPNYQEMGKRDPNLYGGTIVKRAVGLPGQQLLISIPDSVLDPMERMQITHTNLYPYDSTVQWNLGHYGVLWIPKKREVSILSPAFDEVLKMDSCLFPDSVQKTQHVFCQNYYFMMGDNFWGSQDSRFWGFVPELHIVGKVVCIFFSMDPNKVWYRAFRWDRFLKIVE
jgi:signal peptidase I